MPVNNSRSCSAFSVTAPSRTGGQVNAPLSRRLVIRHSPDPSQTSSFKRSDDRATFYLPLVTQAHSVVPLILSVEFWGGVSWMAWTPSRTRSAANASAARRRRGPRANGLDPRHPDFAMASSGPVDQHHRLVGPVVQVDHHLVDQDTRQPLPCAC